MSNQTIFGKIFDNMEQNRNEQSFQNAKSIVSGTPKKGAFVISLVITVIVALIGFYVTLLPLTIFNPGSVIALIFLIGLFTLLYTALKASFTKFAKGLVLIMALLALYLVVGTIISMPIFHAKSYQQQLVLDQDADFFEDNQSISYETIPVVDRDSAMRLGDRQMGEIVEYVSQFEVTDSYSQINKNGTPVRVTPLEYSDIIKWWTNKDEGLPAYIEVDMVTQDAKVVELEEGMKYSQSELFGRNIERHIRFNYPTLMFERVAFEIDEDGVPYYISPSYEYKIGLFGGKDITGAVLVNAITGEHKYYDVDDVPDWVDRVYPSTLVTSQLQNWGKYVNGYWNSVFTQKGVLQPTEGYNYIVIDDDVYFYTGLTSVSKDASNVGFALINLRTKEAKLYDISGAEEYSAMSSAEGQVQNLGYTATFPILVNAQGTPSYFLSLKDSAGLVKQYAFVSVEDYQIVATGSSVAEAEENYYKLLENRGKDVNPSGDVVTKDGVVTEINEAVVEGNSTYYFTLEGDDTVYVGDISLSNKLPLLEPGQAVTIEFIDNEDDTEIISSILIK